MAKLVLVRHGQSVWNERNLFTGWVDVPLSTLGIEEALKAGDALRQESFDVVFTSSLVRAQTTTFLILSRQINQKTPVVQHPDGVLRNWGKIYNPLIANEILPIFYASDLNERMYGELQGLDKKETAEKYGAEQVQKWRRSYDLAPPGGESLQMTSKRALPYFEQHVFPYLVQGKNVLIVAHGNSLRAIIMNLESLTPEEILKRELETGSPQYYQFCNGHFKPIS